jgi:NADH-quinone oxidoreductase subunit H
MFHFWPTLITIAAAVGAVMTTCAMLIYVERKVAAYVQDRVGPNRVGPAGLLQSVADGLKFILKEEIIPDYVNTFLFILAPALALTTSLLAFAVVPFGHTIAPPEPGVANYAEKLAEYENAYQFVIAPRVDIGIVFVFAIGSLAVYAIVLGGWSSNSKYSFLGALRSSAQLVSYEIPMGMSILGVVLFTGSLNLERIIAPQTAGILHWNVWYQPLGFLLFLVSVFAETNRLPFDLSECEQELIGGYHTEYSAMKFALFFLGEYAHMITTSFLIVALFFGGWHFPGLTGDSVGMYVAQLIVFAAKMSFFILFSMLIRWTIPRFRFDQLMGLAWKVLIPLALANLVCTAVVQQMISVEGANPAWRWVLLPVSLLLLVGAGVVAGYWPADVRGPLRVRREQVYEALAR